MRGAEEKIKGAYGVFNFYISTSYKEVYIFEIFIEILILNKIYFRFFQLIPIAKKKEYSIIC